MTNIDAGVTYTAQVKRRKVALSWM